jgi:hypothetical protein
MNNCTICGKPIILSPSASERAAKDVTGKSSAYYTSLFTTHADCAIAKRSVESVDLMRIIAHH